MLGQPEETDIDQLATFRGDSTITVNNLRGEGAGPITVNTPSGGQTIVPPGAQGVIVRT